MNLSVGAGLLELAQCQLGELPGVDEDVVPKSKCKVKLLK